MLKPILIFILFTTSFLNSAGAQNNFHFDDNNEQYAIINDSDGFTNIRKLPDGKAPVVGKINNYQLFSCEPNKTNWWKVLFIARSKNVKEQWIEGYVYKNHIEILNNWIDINGIISGNSTNYVNKDLFISIKTESFDAKGHKLFYDKYAPSATAADELAKIDGKYFWGTDGTIPHKCLESIIILYQHEKIDFPEIAYDDLYEPKTRSISVAGKTSELLFIKMDNSDGAGAYTIIWVFNNGKYIGRYIDDSID